MAFPSGVPADGMVVAAFTPTIADIAAPTAAEWNGAGAINASCYITALETTGDAQVIEDRRLCSKQTFEDFSTVTRTLTITYVYDPQNAGGDDNALYEALAEGTLGYFGLFWGLDADEGDAVIATGDVADIYPVKAGPQVKNSPEANSKLTVTQRLFVRGPVELDAAVAGA